MRKAFYIDTSLLVTNGQDGRELYDREKMFFFKTGPELACLLNDLGSMLPILLVDKMLQSLSNSFPLSEEKGDLHDCTSPAGAPTEESTRTKERSMGWW